MDIDKSGWKGLTDKMKNHQGGSIVIEYGTKTVTAPAGSISVSNDLDVVEVKQGNRTIYIDSGSITSVTL